MTGLDARLALYAAGALDPDEAALLARRIAADPDLATRLEGLQRALAVPAAGDDWRLPPPGLGLGLRMSIAGVMGARSARIGESLGLALPPGGDHDDHRVVLLRRVDGPWKVEAPPTPAAARLLSEVATATPDGPVVKLRLRGPVGSQRLGLVLVPPDRWQGGEDWAWLLAAVATASLPVGSVDVGVVG